MRAPSGPDLFDAAADAAAYADPNLARSTAKASIVAPTITPIDDGLALEIRSQPEPFAVSTAFGPRVSQKCKQCGSTFIAKPRRPRWCNLCRRDPDRATRKPVRQKRVHRPSR